MYVKVDIVRSCFTGLKCIHTVARCQNSMVHRLVISWLCSSDRCGRRGSRRRVGCARTYSFDLRHLATGYQH